MNAPAPEHSSSGIERAELIPFHLHTLNIQFLLAYFSSFIDVNV
jgi:hypothetical protein